MVNEPHFSCNSLLRKKAVENTSLGFSRVLDKLSHSVTPYTITEPYPWRTPALTFTQPTPSQRTCQHLFTYCQWCPSVCFLHPLLGLTDSCSSFEIQESLPPGSLPNAPSPEAVPHTQQSCVQPKFLVHKFIQAPTPLICNRWLTCSSYSLDCNYPTSRNSVLSLLPAESLSV